MVLLAAAGLTTAEDASRFSSAPMKWGERRIGREPETERGFLPRALLALALFPRRAGGWSRHNGGVGLRQRARKMRGPRASSALPAHYSGFLPLHGRLAKPGAFDDQKPPPPCRPSHGLDR